MAKSLDYRKHQWKASGTVPELVLEGSSVEEAGSLDLKDFVFVLRTRFWWIVCTAVLGVAVATLVTLTMTPSYTAKATLFVSVNSSQDTAYARGQFALQRVASYPQLINDPKLINQVIEDLNLDRSFQDVKSSLTATNPTETVLISVTATASDAQQAADIANTAAPLLGNSISKLENTDPKKLSVTAELSVPASPPQFATSPRKSVNLALGLVSGVSLGLLLALVVHKLDPRIRRARDVEKQLGLRVLGTVTPFPQTGSRTQTTGSELGYRQLVSNLLMANDGRLPQRILVMGARQDSVVDALIFAQSLAALGKRAVVVQGDASIVPFATDTATHKGLTQVLSGTVDLHEALVRIESVPMGYLPAGVQQDSLRRFDVFSNLGSLITSLESEFDVVVVISNLDGAPVDATAIALHSDCVILTCREKKTTYRQLDRALRELNAVRVGSTGIVILEKTRLFRRRPKRQ